MQSVVTLRRRVTITCWAGLVALISGACREPKRQSAEQEHKAAPVLGCALDTAGREFTLKARGSLSASDVEQQFFAVELGRATSRGDELLVPFVSGDGRETQAALAWVKHDLSGGEIIDLGVVHADSAPPQVAVAGDRIVVAVADADARGESYRVGALTSRADPATERVEWLAELDGGDDESPAFDVAASPSGGLLVWDDWSKTHARGYVQVAVIPAVSGQGAGKAGGQAAGAKQISPPDVDAEAPRVLARRGDGYWVAWVALGEPIPQKTAAEGDDPALLNVTRRWVQLARVDAQGNLDGAVLDVTPRDGHAMGFDVLAGHAGDALIAWRDVDSAPGLGGGTLHLATVRADGTVDTRVLRAEGVGNGVPALVFDPDPGGGAPHGWLVSADGDGATHLLALTPQGEPIQGEPMKSEPMDGVAVPVNVRDAAALAARQGSVVFAKPRGRDATLLLVRCGMNVAGMSSAGMSSAE